MPDNNRRAVAFPLFIMECPVKPTLRYGHPAGRSLALIAALGWLGRLYRLCRVDIVAEALVAGHPDAGVEFVRQRLYRLQPLRLP